MKYKIVSLTLAGAKAYLGILMLPFMLISFFMGLPVERYINHSPPTI